MTDKPELGRIRRKEMKDIAERTNADLVLVVLFREDDELADFTYQSYSPDAELDDRGGDVLDELVRIAQSELPSS